MFNAEVALSEHKLCDLENDEHGCEEDERAHGAKKTRPGPKGNARACSGDSAAVSPAAKPIADERESGIFPWQTLCDEECEGGTRAVGGDVPGIARKELSVFSRPERETAKRTTMFDT